MTAQSKATIIPPPGTKLGRGKESSYCKAYRKGLENWCKKPAGKRKGDFNSHVFKALKEIDEDLYNKIAKTREIPIGVLTGGAAEALSGPAATQMEGIMAGGGLTAFKGPAFLFRIIQCSRVRGKMGDVDRVLCPDARTPDGTPMEIKRPTEPESHDDQRKNYAEASGKGKCVGWDAQNCIGKGTYTDDCAAVGK
jgi:hypothetical protein